MRFLLYGAALVVTLYALIDCLLTPRLEARVLPKWLWIVLIVLAPVLGAVAWLFAGRASRATADVDAGSADAPRGRTRGRRAPMAPDDDPAFLRKLSDDEWSRKMRERREGDGPATT